MHSILRHQALHVIALIDVGATNVLDLADADNAPPWLVARFHESGNIWHVRAKDIGVRVAYFLKAFQSGEEGTPEHCEQQSTRYFPLNGA